MENFFVFFRQFFRYRKTSAVISKPGLREGFTPIDINMVPGKGTDVDGKLLQPSAFELSMQSSIDGRFFFFVFVS